MYTLCYCDYYIMKGVEFKLALVPLKEEKKQQEKKLQYGIIVSVPFHLNNDPRFFTSI